MPSNHRHGSNLRANGFVLVCREGNVGRDRVGPNKNRLAFEQTDIVDCAAEHGPAGSPFGSVPLGCDGAGEVTMQVLDTVPVGRIVGGRFVFLEQKFSKPPIGALVGDAEILVFEEELAKRRVVEADRPAGLLTARRFTGVEEMVRSLRPAQPVQCMHPERLTEAARAFVEKRDASFVQEKKP